MVVSGGEGQGVRYPAHVDGRFRVGKRRDSELAIGIVPPALDAAALSDGAGVGETNRDVADIDAHPMRGHWNRACGVDGTIAKLPGSIGPPAVQMSACGGTGVVSPGNDAVHGGRKAYDPGWREMARAKVASAELARGVVAPALDPGACRDTTRVPLPFLRDGATRGNRAPHRKVRVDLNRNGL